MKPDPIRSSFDEAAATLRAFLDDPHCLEGVRRFVQAAAQALRGGKKLLACGNGGSLCDAMHFAEEWTGRFRKDREPHAVIALSDPAHMSCVANDYGFDQVFVRGLETWGSAGDLLLGLSTSGNSPNVFRAAERACSLGMKVVGLLAITGFDAKHIKRYADVTSVIRGAIESYVREVKGKVFPTDEQGY